MKKFLIFLINVYQKTQARSHSACRFIPTCSQYTKEAIEKYGISKGVAKGVWRIVRCAPWSHGGYDPV